LIPKKSTAYFIILRGYQPSFSERHLNVLHHLASDSPMTHTRYSDHQCHCETILEPQDILCPIDYGYPTISVMDSQDCSCYEYRGWWLLFLEYRWILSMWDFILSVIVHWDVLAKLLSYTILSGTKNANVVHGYLHE
jgi:hypothetical protein